MHNLKKENSILKAELTSLRRLKLDGPFFLEMMTKRFLTTWKLLYKLYLCMNYVLSPIQQLLLTLLRLHLNLCGQDWILIQSAQFNY